MKLIRYTYEPKEVKGISAIPFQVKIAPHFIQKDKTLKKKKNWPVAKRGAELVIQKVEILNTFFMCLYQHC